MHRPCLEELAMNLLLNQLAQTDPTPLARALVQRIEVHTAYGPSFEFKDPFKPGPPNPYLQRLKPQIKMTTPGGPVTIQPYGPPGETKWPLVSAVATTGAVVGGLATLYLILR